LPQNDVAAVTQALRTYAGGVAAVLVEPTGGAMGNIPIEPGFLHELRRLTTQAGVLLIFDEVVTGFRVAPGGAQAQFGITPDITTLAKILAGGLPGGAVAGRANVLAQIDVAGNDGAPRAVRISHPGTFNANPLSAAAGIAALGIIATGEPQRAATAAAKRLAAGMNEVIQRRDVAGCVYGHASILNIVLGVETPRPRDGITWEWPSADHSRVPYTPLDIHFACRRAMINEGVDLMGMRPIVSAAHSDADIDFTVAAFDRALGAMQEEGLLQRG
jgi:glutamate-1-semialdehyde 2,1-aminomutase